jgi:hypothetical protein
MVVVLPLTQLLIEQADVVGDAVSMHLTSKKEATKPPAKNVLQQQAKLDRFIECYNRAHPHQALGMRYPAELYSPSVRLIRGSQSSSIRCTIG